LNPGNPCPGGKKNTSCPSNGIGLASSAVYGNGIGRGGNDVGRPSRSEIGGGAMSDAPGSGSVTGLESDGMIGAVKRSG
jgi:hypothetical protein